MNRFLAILILLFLCFTTACSDKEEQKEVRISDNATWYEYDADNIWGIKATVYDDHQIIYIFDADTCPFEKKAVNRAFEEGRLYGCKPQGMKTDAPVKCEFTEYDGQAYLVLTYEYVDPERIDGFWMFCGEDDIYRCGFTRSTMYIDSIHINERHFAGEDGHSYNSESGDDFTQSWNLDDSGVWSEVRNRHYYWDDMPLE